MGSKQVLRLVLNDPGEGRADKAAQRITPRNAATTKQNEHVGRSIERATTDAERTRAGGIQECGHGRATGSGEEAGSGGEDGPFEKEKPTQEDESETEADAKWGTILHRGLHF